MIEPDKQWHPDTLNQGSYQPVTLPGPVEPAKAVEPDDTHMLTIPPLVGSLMGGPPSGGMPEAYPMPIRRAMMAENSENEYRLRMDAKRRKPVLRVPVVDEGDVEGVG